MNISLTPELEQLVKDKVSSGKYHSVSELMGEALRLLEERDACGGLRQRLRDQRLAELKAKIQVGIEELERGEGIDGSVEVARTVSGYRDLETVFLSEDIP